MEVRRGSVNADQRSPAVSADISREMYSQAKIEETYEVYTTT